MFWGLISALVLALGVGTSCAEPRADDLSAQGFREVVRHGRTLWLKEVPNVLARDPLLGFSLKPGVSVRTQERGLDEIIWDKIYTVGADGLRYTPQDALRTRKRFVALWGDSFTFGVGLNDDETLGHYLAGQLPGYRVYNFGVGSSASNIMLARLQETPWSKPLREADGVLVYLPLGADVGRVNGFAVEMGWMGPTPYFVRRGEHFTRQGTLADRYASRANLLTGMIGPKLLEWLGNWPPVYFPWHIQYTCELIRESAQAFQRRYPSSRFIVIGHPLFPLSENLNRCLRDAGLDVRTIAMEQRDEYYIPLDKHPSVKFNTEFAEILAREISREAR